MFVCPHCQFDNPETNRFCQRCGTSLVEKECPVCGTLVAFSAEYCQQCHLTTGTTWKTLLIPLSSPVRSVPVGSLAGSTAGAALFSEPASLVTSTGKFLDPAQRYQLLEPLPQQSGPSTEIELRVLDHQPLRITNLALQTTSEPTETTVALVPAIAESYLTLEHQFPLLPLPHLHDAWQQQNFAVLLLEDRSDLPLLVDLWRDELIEPLQSLHWLHQMTELWVVLAEQQCCRSLLELSNLRVDEDQLLCLQRLYADRADQPASLIQLGQFWQQLLKQSQRTQNAELARLCVDLEVGAIATPDDLRLRIEAIAATLQAVAPPPGAPMASSNSPDPSTETTQDLLPPGAAADLNPDAHTDSEVNLADEDEGSDDLPTVVLAMRLVSLEDAGRTDIGRQRNHNEDCFSIQTELHKQEAPQGRSVQAKGLYILCDGMGGHASGEVASALAVETLQTYFAEHWQDKLPSEDTIRAGIQLANRKIFDQNQQNSSAGSGRMGTTLVLLLVQDAEAVIAHVGDSRLYRLSRRRGLQQLTIDHEVGQREIQRGVEPALAYARPDAYQLTQALGPRDENFLNPDVKFLELNEDGILLLCSDGLSDNDLLETHWQTHLEPLLDQRANLEQGVNHLIELANQHNGHDNITAIAVRVKVRPNLDQMPR